MKSRSPKRTRQAPVPKNSFRIVGVGASAGGLDAFTRLLRPLPVDTGMGFVLVQHLDPEHKSMLTEILGRETRMRVSEVRDKTRVAPNQVYVTPPNTQIRIRNGVLYLTPRDPAPARITPIDSFLRSLAADKGPAAIAVILSGADGDGTHALVDIRAGGGLTFAQDSTSAKFGTMPAQAVATGLADFVLPPERIAQELVRISRTPAGTSAIAAPDEDLVTTEEDALSKIYFILRRDRGVDFTHYKQTTLRRRIQRRMLVHNVSQLKDYAKLLKTHAHEVGALYDDLLIHVTSFFRDPEVFEFLKKKAFPHLLKKNASPDGIRIWAPGCATGEEVYSVAISLLEYLGPRAAQTRIQIFATDISEPALQKARIGTYPAAVLRNVSSERLRRFFSPAPGGHQINKSIRRMCIFSKQNVAKDPPFSRLDLITCRNLMIYLGPLLQKKVLPIFHFALKTTGLLLLGKSETLGNSELFTPFDKRAKLYSKSATPLRQRALFSATDYPAEALALDVPRKAGATEGLNLQKEADQYILEKRAPAGIIVDPALNIVHFRGDTGPYLELAPGAATFQLFKLAKEGLMSPLRQALQKAKKDKRTVRSDEVQIGQKGRARHVSVEVVPLGPAPSKDPYYLILFEERKMAPQEEGKAAGAARVRAAPAAYQATEQEKVRLKKELAAAKEYLQSVIDEHDRITEELKSANEEAQSSNEEFQSTNEELETAKEELQATNEETTTLNDDLQARNIELNQLNNDLLNLTNSVSIPTIILGKDHQLRRMTASAERALSISRADMGRSIHDLKLSVSDVDLKDRIDTVLNTLVPQESDIQDLRGQWYRLRIQLYKTVDDVIDGVVLSFSDIQLAKEHQLATQAWTETLEKRVRERTDELAHSQAALLQAEKLEAIGRLAGGVAHDYNNLMTGILLITQDVREHLGEGHPQREALKEVIIAAKKATGITKQLLAFGRRQDSSPQIVNINTIIGGMEKLLQRLLGEEFELATVLDPKLGHVNMDPGSLEQVILNLALNARDAMPNGGTIKVTTANAKVTSEGEVPPGSYIVLTVSDEGTGISPEIMPHIFEPFFTTKGEKKGTGLGLATVYGIVKQSRGAISVDSKPGEGTSFKIFLPFVKPGKPVDRRRPGARETRGGDETILITEDEPILQKAVVRALQQKGYTVLRASNGRQALKIVQAHTKTIHLLLTDVIMPGMNGRELAVSALRKRPHMKILFMSGHNREIIAQREILKPGSVFIEKSFSSESLCQKIREVLDSPATGKHGA